MNRLLMALCAIAPLFGVQVFSQVSAPLLKVGPTGHYLVDESGVPFQLRGEAAWCLPVQLTREDVLVYLNDRQAKGFNAFMAEIINVDDGYAANAPKNAYGELPFLNGDFRQRNEAYWTHIDFILDESARRGLVVLMSALYLGYNGGSEGWYAAAVSAGADAVRDYGTFLGARYGNRKNLIWVNGGDFRPPSSLIPDALAAGILSADARHLITTHWARNSSGTEGNPSWLSLNSSYTGVDNLPARVLADYAAAPNLPTILLESHYEGTIAGQPQLTNREVRGEAWQAYLSGACGNFFANHSIWPFGSDWRSALGSPGAQSLARLNTFFAGLEWWKLVPDAGDALVIGSKGVGKNYISAALAGDGSFAVIYAPGGGPFTADLSRLSGIAVKATWFDPYGGARLAATGSPFAKSNRAFNASTERGNNADPAGAGDWVLLLETEGTAGIGKPSGSPRAISRNHGPRVNLLGRLLRTRARTEYPL